MKGTEGEDLEIQTRYCSLIGDRESKPKGKGDAQGCGRAGQGAGVRAGKPQLNDLYTEIGLALEKQPVFGWGKN